MFEFNDKYRDVERIQTHSNIDKPMLIFLGLTLFDFVAGVCSFISVVMSSDSGFSIILAISAACGASFLSKSYRNYFPPKFINHFNWSFGLQKFKDVPNFFTKRRIKIFGP